MSVFVFEPDLIFSSKFEGLSRLVEIDFRIFADSAGFLNAACAEKPEALIINLDALESEMLQKAVNIGVPVI